MSTLTIQYRTICILKLYIMVIEDLTVFFSFTNLTPPHPLSFNRMPTFEPVNDIDIMNMLFINMVATKPVKIIPVAHLIFHFGLSGLTWPYPNTIVIPPSLRRSNISYKFFAFIQFSIRVLIMPL